MKKNRKNEIVKILTKSKNRNLFKSKNPIEF